MVSWNPNYSNGNIPTSLLVDYDGLGHYLHANAAASLRAFSNAFAAEFGGGISISEGYRTYATQVYYWNLYNSGKGYPAARPGSSTHGEAVAVDINSWVYGGARGTAKHNWLVANAPRFGWSWELVGKPSGEAWHFNYVGSLTGGNNNSSTAGGNSTPINNENEDDMPDVPTTEQIVRDQTRALAREDKEYRGIISGLVNESVVPFVQGEVLKAMRDNKDYRGAFAGLVNEAVLPYVKEAVAEAVKTVISADRREERERIVAVKDRATRWSVNLDSGKVRRFSSPEDLAYAVKHQLVSSVQNVDGSWSAENPDYFDNEADLKKFFDLVAAPSNPTV